MFIFAQISLDLFFFSLKSLIIISARVSDSFEFVLGSIQIREMASSKKTQSNTLIAYVAALFLAATMASAVTLVSWVLHYLLWQSPSHLSYFPAMGLQSTLLCSVCCFDTLIIVSGPLVPRSFSYSYKISCPYRNLIFIDIRSLAAWT